MNIIILGPQGSGKGTQAALISEHFKTPILATGDIFRAEIASKTKLGKEVKELIQGGFMVPDAITNSIIKNNLRKAKFRRGVILDGYPRNVAQARFLNQYWHPDHVIFLNTSRAVLIKRLKDRLVCVGPKCRLIFHKKYKPSQLKELCDACGGKLQKRKDDNPKSIRERLKIYEH